MLWAMANDRVRTEQLQALFTRLEALGVSAEIRRVLREDLDVERNLEALRADVVDRFPADEVARVEAALQLALASHAGQTQSLEAGRGLTSIPYANHVVQVARWSLSTLGTADATIVGLLHDVVEDTPVESTEVRQRFGDAVHDGVMALTRTDGVSRAAFLEHVRELESPHREVKFFDRYHNLVRGFTVEKVSYLARYLRETDDVYRPMAAAVDTSQLPLAFATVVEGLRDLHARLSAEPQPT